MRNFLFILLFFCISFCQAQIDTSSIYPNLKRKKSPDFLVHTEERGELFYYYGNQKISKEEYLNFKKIQDDYYETPCIRQFFHKDGWLESEAVTYQDCMLGWYKEFFPNGKIKLFGRYKEIPLSQIKSGKSYGGDCFKKDGKWTCFGVKGNILYFEFWDNGNFIRQLPEQKTNEIWKLELILDSLDITFLSGISIDVKNLNRVLFTPKYKNSSWVSEKIEISLELNGEINPTKPTKKFSREEFKKVNFVEFMENRKSTNDRNQWILAIYNNNILISNFYFYIK